MRLFNKKKLHIHSWIVDDDFLERAWREMLTSKTLKGDVAQFCKCGQSKVVTIRATLQYVRN